MAALLGSAAVITVFIIYFILTLVSNWKVFVKYGEPGWKCLIPIYSTYIDCKHVWSVLGFIMLIVGTIVASLANDSSGTFIQILSFIGGIAVLVMQIIHYHYKARAFGKGVGMTLLLIFLPFIGNLVLGLGDADYIGNVCVK